MPSAPLSVPQDASAEVLAAIDAYMAQTENAIAIPYSALNQAISDYVGENGKAIKRITERILREADKHWVQTDNKLNALTTGLLGGIDSYLGETEFMLRDVANRAGLIEPGDPLTQALLTEQAKTPQLEYGATLVLAVKEAVPWLDRIATALERIADKMGPLEAPEVETELPAEILVEDAEPLVGPAYWK